MADNDGAFLNFLRWAVVLVPFVLVLTTAQLRSMIRGNDFFSWENLYLGLDLCISGFAVELVEIADLLREHAMGNLVEAQFLPRLGWGAGLIFVTMTMTLSVAKLHQKWDSGTPRTPTISVSKAPKEQRKIDAIHHAKQVLWLGVLSNLTGVLPMGAFIWLRLTGKF